MESRFDIPEPSVSQRAFAAALRAALEPFRKLRLERVHAATPDPRFEEWVVRDGDASLSYDRRLDGKGLSRVTIREGETVIVGARFGETQGFIEFRGGRDHGVTALTPQTLTFLVETLGSMRNEEGRQIAPPPPQEGAHWYPNVTGRRVVSVTERPDGRYAIDLDIAGRAGRTAKAALSTLGLRLPTSCDTYVGEASVWHDASTGHRAEPRIEKALSDVAFMHRHRSHTRT